MSNKDLMSRDYDVRQVQDDPRLVQSCKEFWVLFLIIAVSVAAIIVVSYVIDWGPVSGYTYILGLPVWMAISTLISILGTAACLIYIAKGMKDAPLDDVQSEGEGKTV